MPQISRLYSLIRVLTAPIVAQVNPIVNCPSHYTGRVSNNLCLSLLVTMLHFFFFCNHMISLLFIASYYLYTIELHKGKIPWIIPSLSIDYIARGWHSNIFCTPIFVLGQNENQKSSKKFAVSQKTSLVCKVNTTIDTFRVTR